MAVRLSLNISHFYNTERGNTVDPNCFPWTDRQEQVASHEKDQVAGRDVEVTSLGILSVLNSLNGNMTYELIDIIRKIEVLYFALLPDLMSE